MDGNHNFLAQLDTVINDRLQGNMTDSYVHKLASSGLDRVLRKVGEEAGEFIIAAKNESHDELLNESADVLFHMMIALKMKQCCIDDVIAILKARHDA